MKGTRRILALVLVLALALPGLGVTAGAAGLPFRDVAQGAWYYDAVAESYDRGFMDGVSDTVFDPEGSMTRAMFVTVLGRLMGVEDGPGAGGSFGDVPANSWYAPYVAWAVEQDITQGTSDTTFSPEELVTREQAATFLYRCAAGQGLSLPDQGAVVFPDGGSISSWARESVAALAAAGIFVGDEAGNFRPAATMTRAEAATILVRFANAVGQGDGKAGNNVYTPEAEDLSLDGDTGITYVNNILLVFFEQSATQAQRDAVVAAVDGTVAGRMDTIGQLQIRIAPRDLTELEALAARVENMAGVFAASYDLAGQYAGSYFPDDPWGAGLFHEESWDVSHPEGNNWWAEAIDAPGAWDYTGELEAVSVGVVDNGFDMDHEDVDLTSINPGVRSTEDHGTHVMGIIAALPDNGDGIAGVAPNAELLCFDWEADALQEALGGWDVNAHILLGLVECIQQGAKVVNFSLGMSGSLADNGKSYSQAALDAQAENTARYLAALRVWGYDYLVVQSAGNGAADGIGVDAVNNGLFASITEDNCPSFGSVTARELLERILIVGACGRPDGQGVYRMTAFSNGGDRVDIAAPGDGIYSTVVGGYGNMSGTSMAAPMVTGAAAVLWGMDGSLTGPEVRRYLLDNTRGTAADSPDSPNTGGNLPILNVHQAVEAVRTDLYRLYGYTSVLLEYVSACTVGQEIFLAGWEAGEYRYVNVTEVNDYYNYGYTFYMSQYDINFDDVPELLVAKEEDGDYVPIGVFGFDGQQVRNLFGDSGDFGYRERLYLCDHGVLCVQGSDSAFSGSAVFYRIGADGFTLEEIERLRYDSRDPEAMTYEEFTAEVARYPRKDHRELPWVFLIGGDTEEPESNALVEAVLAGEDSLWGPVYENMAGSPDGADTALFFLDLDLDGTPEFFVRSPEMGTGSFTYTWVYRLQDGKLELLAPGSVEGDSWLWDDLRLYRDTATGEYFFIGYDYVRAGSGWYDIFYTKYVFSGGSLQESEILFSVSSQGEGAVTHTALGREVSEAEYEDIRGEYFAYAVTELGVPKGLDITKWSSAAAREDKALLLTDALESTPEARELESVLACIREAYDPYEIFIDGMVPGEGGPFFAVRTRQRDGWFTYYVERNLAGAWCAGAGETPFAHGSDTYYQAF